MKEQGLLVTPADTRNKAKRGPIRPKPHAERPNHFWDIDMTKIKMGPPGGGWLYLTHDAEPVLPEFCQY
jgi:hypothetical protein